MATGSQTAGGSGSGNPSGSQPPGFLAGGAGEVSGIAGAANGTDAGVATFEGVGEGIGFTGENIDAAAGGGGGESIAGVIQGSQGSINTATAQGSGAGVRDGNNAASSSFASGRVSSSSVSGQNGTAALGGAEAESFGRGAAGGLVSNTSTEEIPVNVIRAIGIGGAQAVAMAGSRGGFDAVEGSGEGSDLEAVAQAGGVGSAAARGVDEGGMPVVDGVIASGRGGGSAEVRVNETIIAEVDAEGAGRTLVGSTDGMLVNGSADTRASGNAIAGGEAADGFTAVAAVEADGSSFGELQLLPPIV